MKLIKWLIKGILMLVLIAVLFVGVLTAFEYRPNDIETVEVNQNQINQVALNQTLTFMTFNIGYAGLGVDEDFVMDGGSKGRADSKEVVQGYFDGILSLLDEHPADFYMLQEVDLKARRSYQIDQVAGIVDRLGEGFGSQYALNFKSIFVPFPLSLTDYIGPVQSGLQTMGSYQVDASFRQQFPGSFSWPLRVANLKRAMMVSYLDIDGSDKQLVIVNLHMSAYDGDGSMRAQEMIFLKAFLETEYAAGNYVIVGGDFNQTFPEADGIYEVNQDFYVAYPIEDDYLPAGYSFEVDISNPTCRLLNQPYDPSSVLTQYYIIDGFIVSDNIEIVSEATTVDHGFLYSDHNPVVISVRLTA